MCDTSFRKPSHTDSRTEQNDFGGFDSKAPSPLVFIPERKKENCSSRQRYAGEGTTRSRKCTKPSAEVTVLCRAQRPVRPTVVRKEWPPMAEQQGNGRSALARDTRGRRKRQFYSKYPPNARHLPDDLCHFGEWVRLTTVLVLQAQQAGFTETRSCQRVCGTKC